MNAVPSGQPDINAWRAIIKSSPARCHEPARQCPQLRLTVEHDGDTFDTPATVEPDGLRRVYEDIRHRRIPGERLQRTQPIEFGADPFSGGQRTGRAQELPGGLHRRGHPRRRHRPGVRHHGFPDRLEQP